VAGGEGGEGNGLLEDFRALYCTRTHAVRAVVGIIFCPVMEKDGPANLSASTPGADQAKPYEQQGVFFSTSSVKSKHVIPLECYKTNCSAIFRPGPNV
jgi:hypothetical protein